MKRDMDLVRQLLIQLETDGYVAGLPGRTAQEMAYHIALLEDAGLVTQEIYSNLFLNDSMLDGIRITWAGHEFMDASRNASVWEKAKKIALEKTGGLSYEVIKTILVQLAKSAISSAET